MPLQSISCPALFIAAPASGQGKTTVTAALARYFKNIGKRVSVFKTGPDYLDPQILAQASGRPVQQLDLWMAGEAYCREKLYEAAQVSDLILVEGVMGLFDGEPSSADLAAHFGIPIALVMDVKGMAQTAAAVVQGLASFRQDISVIGLIANNCGSARHRELIEESLPDSVELIAALKRSEEIGLPERHLGLVQASEVASQLENRFKAGVDALIEGGIDAFVSSSEFETRFKVDFPNPCIEQNLALVASLKNHRIAVAKDQAFSFIYDANIRLLEEMGATVVYFSPISDRHVPEADALWIPGGYPELHAQSLAGNHSLLESLRSFHKQGKPILAECGGLLYCLEKLSDLDGAEFSMLGLIPGSGFMSGKVGCQGMQTAMLPEGEVRAHSHHRSRSHSEVEPLNYGKRQRHPAPGEPIYRVGSLTASYLHLFFPSNADAIAKLFKRCSLSH